MALLDDVKSELSAIDNELPIAKKAQATAMIRFGNGLHSVDHHILVQVQLDSQDAATWLQDTIKNLYGHEATLTPVSRQTPTGTVQRYVIRVPKGSAALVLQTGLYSRYTKNMVLGLPSDIINGKIAQIKAAWRGAFLANGRLSDPGKASYLEIVCPNHEAALAHSKGMSIEAEVGSIGGVEDGVVGNGEIADPAECAKITDLGIDFLAAGIGNIHGVYPANWKGLDFEALDRIHKATNNIPLVLHGGTGIPDDMIAKAISLGVSKININTECQLVFAEATRKYIEAGKDQQGKGFDPRKLLAPGAKAIEAKCKEKIELFGCAGKG